MNKIRKIINVGILTFVVLLPSIVLADNPLLNVLGNFSKWIGDAIIIAIGLAIVFFFWGLAKYILLNAGDEEKKKEGRNIMIWGVIALFIMVSIWGIVSVLADTFGVDSKKNLDVKNINISSVIVR